MARELQNASGAVRARFSTAQLFGLRGLSCGVRAGLSWEAQLHRVRRREVQWHASFRMHRVR